LEKKSGYDTILKCIGLFSKPKGGIMPVRKKDQKGRVLKTGENQRKDGIYQYRYKDSFGKTQYLYSTDLEKLREKEREADEAARKGVDYSRGNISIQELVERYVSLKRKAQSQNLWDFGFRT
jgi:hypothetical protein